jgi:hypothetical protein
MHEMRQQRLIIINTFGRGFLLPQTSQLVLSLPLRMLQNSQSQNNGALSSSSTNTPPAAPRPFVFGRYYHIHRAERSNEDTM